MGTARTGVLVLLVLCGGAATVLHVLHDISRERIEANRAAARARELDRVLRDTAYTNDPAAEARLIDRAYRGIHVHRWFPVRHAAVRVARVLEVSSIRGYAGPIRFLVAVDVDGAVTGIAIIAHRETPGLGDRVEARNSDWLSRFHGQRLDDSRDASRLAVDQVPGRPRSPWRLREDQGQFDAYTGATVTSRALTESIGLALEFLQREGEPPSQ